MKNTRDDRARAEQAARLLEAARALKAPVQVTLPEIQAVIRAGRNGAIRATGRLAAAGAVALCPVLALGAVGVSRGWWGPRPAVTPTSISVLDGATARIRRPGRFALSLQGPGAVDVRNDDEPIRLASGRLELAASERAVIVEAGAHRVEVAPSSTAAIETGAAADEVRVRSIAGHAPRVDGTVRIEPAPAAEPPSPREKAPVEMAPVEKAPVEAVPVGPAPAPAPPPVAIAANMPAPARARPPVPWTPEPDDEPAPLAPPPAPVGTPALDPSPAADEVAIIHDALERLRGGKDAAAALRLVDEHDRRFPDGLLRDEASVTRIEALLALGRTGEALDRLESVSGALLERSPRLRLARGELRAARGRCREALADFAALASTASPGDEIDRRLARGRAACNSAGPRHTGGLGGVQ
jgi:hypothetical protein